MFSPLPSTMSNLARKISNMAPQVSPKDVPKEEEEETDCGGGPQDEPVIVELDSSSEEEEDVGEEGINTQGYVLLSQDVPGAPEAEGFLEQQTEQAFSSDSSQSTEVIHVPDVDTQPIPGSEPLELNMQQEEVDLIRQVMSNITLPSSAIPDWAKVIPEDKWKASLVSNIYTKSGKSSHGKPEK